jgi:hypothetical protein
LPILMAGDLNAKHVDWISRVSMRIGKLLRDYSDENSCLFFGADSPTTIPYNPSATPDVLDIVKTRHLPSSLHLTSYSALCSVQLPERIDTGCRSSFQHPPDSPDFRRTSWANLQAHQEAEIPFNSEFHNIAIYTSVENFSGAVLKALAASTSKRCPRDEPRAPISAGIRDEIRLKHCCGGGGRSPGTPP